MKLKHCPICDLDLPRDSFTSVRAKYCIKCKRIRELEQAQVRKQRQIDRLKNRKPKTKVKVKRAKISVAELKKKAQRVFNAWIRQRDKDLPCLACRKKSDKMDASHYASQGSSGYLRYHPENVNNTCYSCNRFKHGNLISYREGLVDKIGEERVVWLEKNRKKIHKYTREQLNEIIKNCKHNTLSVGCWYEIMQKV